MLEDTGKSFTLFCFARVVSTWKCALMMEYVDLYCMCVAVREREQRQRLRDLALFERINGNPAKTSAELAVKKVKTHTPITKSDIIYRSFVLG